jgi:hypothetical protein
MTLPLPEYHGLPPEATVAVPVPVGGLTDHRLLDRTPDRTPYRTREEAATGIRERS